jgi:predicted PurR-regulated permease PerM
MLGTVQKGMENWSIELIPGEQIRFADYVAQISQQLQEGAPRLASNLLVFSQTFLSSTALVGAALFAIPLITLYFLLDSKRLRLALVTCFNRRLQPDVERALDAINISLSGYIYSKTLMSLFVGLATWLMLVVLSVPFSAVLALLAFFGEFIPIVGSWIAFAFVAVVVLANEPLDLLWIIPLTLLIQIIQNYLISPKLMGDKMNLHPLTVVIAMLTGGVVGGLAGLVMALPAAAAAKILLNIFVLRREERGIVVPQLDLISTNDGGADFHEKHGPAGSTGETGGEKPAK